MADLTPEAMFADAAAKRAESERLAKESADLERQARELAEQARVLAETQRALFRWQDPTDKECHLTVHKEGDAIVFVGQQADYEGGPVRLPSEAVDQLIEALCRARGVTMDAERVREAAATIVENAAIAAGDRMRSNEGVECYMSLHALASDIRVLPLVTKDLRDVTTLERRDAVHEGLDLGHLREVLSGPELDAALDAHAKKALLDLAEKPSLTGNNTLLTSFLCNPRPLGTLDEMLCSVEFLEAVTSAIRRQRDRATRNGEEVDARAFNDRLTILEKLTIPLARALVRAAVMIGPELGRG